MPKFLVSFKKEVQFIVEANSLEEVQLASEKTQKELPSWLNYHGDNEWWEANFYRPITGPLIKANSCIDEDGYLEEIG